MTESLMPIWTWRSAVVSSDLPAMAKLVALALSLHMNERSNSAWPSAQTVANETSLSVSTVWASLKKLQDDGWVTVLERGGRKGERRRANVYQTCIPIQEPDGLPIQDTDGYTRTRPGDRARPLRELDTNCQLNNSSLPIQQADGSSTRIGRPMGPEAREAAKAKLRETLARVRVGENQEMTR